MSWRNEMQRPSLDGRAAGRRAPADDWQNRLKQLTFEYRSLRKTIEIAKSAKQLTKSADQQLPQDVQKNVEDLTGNFEKFLALFLSPLKEALPSDQPTEEALFAQENSDVVFEMIVFLADSICQMVKHSKPEMNEQTLLKNLLLRFTNLVTNLTEKSPFQISKAYLAFNRLVQVLSEIGTACLANLSSTDMEPNQRTLVETLRAIGSVVYANGSCLSEDNLKSLLGDDRSTAGFLASLRASLEQKITAERARSAQTKDLNKLDLITTQLVFNLTLPHLVTYTSNPAPPGRYNRNSSNHNASISSQPGVVVVVQTRHEYIADKFKLRCVFFLVRILRFHASYIKQTTKQAASAADQPFTQETGSHFASSASKCRLSDEDLVNSAKIVTKSLQGLENLLASIELLRQQQQQSDEAAQIGAQNWIFSSANDYQLGDILAIAKSFSFFSLQNLTGSDPAKAPLTNQLHENKLKPSAISIPSLPNNNNNAHEVKSARKKKPTDEDDEAWNTDEDAASKPKGKSDFKSKNKRLTKTNDQRHSGSSETSASVFVTNSVRCLKDQQVALMQTRPFNNSGLSEDVDLNSRPLPGLTSDSEVSNSESSGFIRSSASTYIESCCAKVRVSALGVLQTVFECVDKKTVLSYWDSFLDSSNTLTLMWLVKNDQSPKVRLMATNTLAVYLECARSFFTIAATDSNSVQLGSTTPTSTSFLPISYKIASLIRQYHNDLLVSLCRLEKNPANIIQLLKCLQSLIKATPYQKLKSGLVYKLLTNLCLLLNSKTMGLGSATLKPAGVAGQVSVVVAVISCIQFILTVHNQLAEVHLALISPLNVTKRLVADKIGEQESELSDKLEQISFSFKKPVLTPSRVTYFYTNAENAGNLNSSSFSSSLNCSASNSGHMTPLYSVACLSDEAGGREGTTVNNKCWFIDFCIRHAATPPDHLAKGAATSLVRLACLDALLVISSKYFDMLNRDIFLKQICDLILGNIEQLADSDTSQLTKPNNANNELFQTLKLLEEFARCLATNELRELTNIDLNDCCQFWSAVLASKLVTQLLVDEQRYMISSTACDCLAAMGAPVFELLSKDKRIVCFTSLLHLATSQSNMIRSASIRALGVFITFPSLKEDYQFLYDVASCLLHMLNTDSNNLVRQQASWSLSNLSEVLVENGDKLGTSFTDEFQLTVWLSLLKVASDTCARESDKLKSYLVRALGNLLNYISKIQSIDLAEPKLAGVEGAINKAVDALCQCKSAKMLKVKWNLSYSIGVAIRQMITWRRARAHWVQSLYETLIELFSLSNNFKVQINACTALMTINLNDVKGHSVNGVNGKSINTRLWTSLMEAFAKLNTPNENQQFNSAQDQHKKTLMFQLCRLFTYLCKYVRLDDLEDVMLKSLNELKLNQISSNQADHNRKASSLTITGLRECLKGYLLQIFEQIESNKAEIQIFNEAVTQLNLLKSSASTSLHEDCIALLLSVLQKPTSGKSDQASKNEPDEFGKSKDQGFREKYPFKQTYD